MRLDLTSRARSSVLRFMKYLCSCVPLFVFFDRPEKYNLTSQCQGSFTFLGHTHTHTYIEYHMYHQEENVRCVRTWFFGECGDSTGQRVCVDPALCNRLSGAHRRVQTAPGVSDRHHRETVHWHVLRIWHTTHTTSAPQTRLHFIHTTPYYSIHYSTVL